VKWQTVKLITHPDIQQRFRIRGALPPMKHTFARRVAEAQTTSFEKNLNIVANFNGDLRRIIAVNIYCTEYVATKPRVVFRGTEE
jgi:hypothetical protein